jgi:hypothetical protein
MALGIGRVLSKAGRGMNRVVDSKGAVAAIGVGAFGLGVANTAAPAARDAAFDFAFGNPDADIAFTGRKLDTRFLIGTETPGIAGFAMRFSSPSEYKTFNSPIPTGNEVVGAAVGGGVLGATAAGLATKMFFKKGNLATAGAAAVAGIAGTIAGGSSALVGTRQMMRENERFYKESPYARNSSSNISSSTNATGDIVLGMHNSRRGY